MWKSFSLQTRLSVLFCTLLLSFALMLTGLFAFSIQHLNNEREPSEHLAAQIAAALDAEAREHPTERGSVTRIMQRLNDQAVGHLRYRDPNAAYESPQQEAFAVPGWFAKLIGAQTQPRLFPVGSFAQLALYPSDAADVYEKWIAFVVIVASPLILGAFAFVAAQGTLRTTLRPLRDAGAAISRLKDGDYAARVSCSGPPEVARTCEEINTLAGVLASLRAANLVFIKRIVSAQDDERAEIGRELHDEFAPLLFAARANAHALQQHHGEPELTAQASEVARVVEAIQKTNGRLLARLRPLDLENVGLSRSIAALVDGPAAKAGNLAAEVRLDPALDRLDETSARTIYRFVQEAVTNVLRHASASRARVLASIEGSAVRAEVSDNGVGIGEQSALGRGLLGMQERISALGGTFGVTSTSSGTIVRCTLPLS